MNIDKLDKFADYLLIVLKKLFSIYFSLIKSIIGYAIVSGIYLSIYYTKGLDVTLILLGCGVVYFGLKNKQDNFLLKYKLKKLEEKKKGV